MATFSSKATDIPSTAQLRDWHRQADYKLVLEAEKAHGQHFDNEQKLLHALSLVMSGNPDQGLPLLNPLRDSAPGNDAWASDLALASLFCGDPEGAATSLLSLTAQDSATAVDLSRLAAVRLAQVRLEDAAALYREATQREPGRAYWHSNLATVLMRLQQWEDALEEFEAALRITPDLEQALNGKRELLLALERGDELISELEQELAAEPQNDRRRRQLARALFRNGRVTDALGCLREGLEDASDLLVLRDSDPAGFPQKQAAQTRLRLAMADMWMQRSAYRRAYAVLENARSFQSDTQAELDSRAIACLIEMQQLELAEQRLADLEQENIGPLAAGLLRGQILTEQEAYSEAESLLRALLANYPGHAGLLCQLGQCLLWTGKLDEAAECFQTAARLQPMALAQLSRTRRWPEDEATLTRMASIADNPLVPEHARISMSFALADSYDRLDQTDTAWHYLATANQLTASQLQYQPAQFQQWVDRNMQTFTQEFFEQMKPVRPAHRQIVFVVGMPRSGTTLVEQILSAHPDVFGAGELDLVPTLTRLLKKVLHSEQHYPECAKELTPTLREEAARYLLHGLDLHDTAHPVIVDKMPHNFVNLGLIASAMPNARVVWVCRDPRDVALSNFQQNFKARHGGMGFAFDLEHLAAQINDQQRIMQHWQKILPLPLLTLRYEALVQQQEEESRRLLAFLDLPWDDAVLRFSEVDRAVRTASAAQVRESMYQSAQGKWRRYESQLQPLVKGLSKATLEGYD